VQPSWGSNSQSTAVNTVKQNEMKTSHWISFDIGENSTEKEMSFIEKEMLIYMSAEQEISFCL